MIKVIRYSISKSSKILFLGSDNFAYHPLVSIHKQYSNLDVVTHHTQPGIKSLNKVQEYCKNQSISYSTPIHKTTKEQKRKQWSQFNKQLYSKQYQLGVICSYGFMIPQYIIKCFKQGMIVIHPSLLPKYRGGAPIFHTIANGDNQSGVSFIQTSANVFDAGNILHQSHLKIPNDKQYMQIQEMLSINAAQNINYVIENIQKLRPGKRQNKQQESKAPIINSKHLDFKEPSQRVYNLSRAIKGPRVKFQDKELIIKLKNQFVDGQNHQVGTVFRKGKKGVYIVCGDGKAIRMVQFKQPSKVFYPASAFINQYLKNQSVVKFI